MKSRDSSLRQFVKSFCKVRHRQRRAPPPQHHHTTKATSITWCCLRLWAQTHHQSSYSHLVNKDDDYLPSYHKSSLYSQDDDYLTWRCFWYFSQIISLPRLEKPHKFGRKGHSQSSIVLMLNCGKTTVSHFHSTLSAALPSICKYPWKYAYIRTRFLKKRYLTFPTYEFGKEQCPL